VGYKNIWGSAPECPPWLRVCSGTCQQLHLLQNCTRPYLAIAELNHATTSDVMFLVNSGDVTGKPRHTDVAVHSDCSMDWNHSVPVVLLEHVIWFRESDDSSLCYNHDHCEILSHKT